MELKYLQGKSAQVLFSKLKEKVFEGVLVNSISKENEEDIQKQFDIVYCGYVKKLEVLVMLAINDALLNAEEVKELIQDGEYKTQ